MPYFKQITQSVLSLFYPATCLGCGAKGMLFCQECQRSLTFLKPPRCDKCGYFISERGSVCQLCRVHPLRDLNSARSVALYQCPRLKKAINQFKYKSQHAVSRDFATLLQRCYRDNHLDTNIIVPVPLHHARQRERGYNQSLLLAKQLSYLIQQPLNTRTLVRNRATPRQVSLSAVERQMNVENAFDCLTNDVAHKVVLLIDDVFTTGATLNACAKALKKGQAKAVHGLTLARAV